MEAIFKSTHAIVNEAFAGLSVAFLAIFSLTIEQIKKHDTKTIILSASIFGVLILLFFLLIVACFFFGTRWCCCCKNKIPYRKAKASRVPTAPARSILRRGSIQVSESDEEAGFTREYISTTRLLQKSNDDLSS